MDALFALTRAAPAPPQAAQVEVTIEEGVHEVLARELEELDFYLSQKLHEEALVLLTELKERYGDHPAIRRREAQMASAEPVEDESIDV